VNIKRWFAWFCLAMMLGAEIFLFRANRAADAARTDLRAAQIENQQLSDKIADLQNSSSDMPTSELSHLRKQNESLTNKITALQIEVQNLQAENTQTADHLATARTALQMQQDHLRELSQENQRAQAVAVTAQVQSQAQIAAQQRTICINNLRQIDAAKQQWALENNKTADAIPSETDITPYLKGNVLPTCPAGGIYLINAVSTPPTCSVAGHVLPQ
jgi:septal ring factor EnvC (AmiA/AmiB activator)